MTRAFAAQQHNRGGNKPMRTMRLTLRLALPVGAMICALTAAHAQSDAVREACTPDAMRLCSEFIPDANKVRSCMMRKSRQIGPECRAAMRAGGGGGGRHARGHYRHASHHCRHCR